MADKHLIYAVDDELSIRELYACALESAGFDCVCFEDAAGLLKAMQTAKPSLILLDIMLEGTDGFKVLEKLKDNARYSDVPVIMVSAKGEETSKVKGLNMGADDYIAKPFGVMELVARIKANIRKWASNAAEETKATAYADLSVNDARHEIAMGDKVLPLTLKEYNLLKLLIENAGKAMKRNEILNAVWGGDFFGETRTLDMHIKQLRKKTVGSAAKIETVRGVGYRLQ